MYILDINVIMFFINSLKFPTTFFNIKDYDVHFTIGSTYQAVSAALSVPLWILTVHYKALKYIYAIPYELFLYIIAQLNINLIIILTTLNRIL